MVDCVEVPHAKQWLRKRRHQPDVLCRLRGSPPWSASHSTVSISCSFCVWYTRGRRLTPSRYHAKCLAALACSILGLDIPLQSQLVA
eukprot:653551-Amphidinium_carterae.3